MQQTPKLTVAAEETAGYEWVALSVTTLGALLAALQGSALLIALPDILVGLRASFLTIMWVLLGYLLITTALVPVIGRLADMFGRKNLYNAGFLVFTLGSLAAGLSQAQFHGVDLLIARMIQGVGGALLLTNSTAIVTDAFKSGRVGLGLGVNQIAAAAGLLLGPVAGGLLTALSWRWVFLINVPLGIFGTIWGIRRLREPVALPARQQFDWLGSLTFTLGLGALLMALSMVAFPSWGWTIIYVLFVFGPALLIAFIFIELRSPAPMLDVRLFKRRLFAFANAANLLNGVARGAVLFLLIFFLQGPYGKDPLTAGLMMAPFGLAFMAIGPMSGYLSDHHGPRILGTIGLIVSAIGLAGLATVTNTTPYWELAIWMALMGGGSGFFSSPNTSAIMTSVRPEQRGMAAGVRMMLAYTGQMLSIAIAFPLVLAKIPQTVMMNIFIYGGGMGKEPAALATFLHGIHLAFVISAIMSVVAAVASMLQPAMARRKEPTPQVAAHVSSGKASLD
ncbi:MAG TPA: MFS transporter [Nitrolancea sp.]|jgi:EmrB/QacA subfamily drug resistance transporter|nr:MFS transporter [Nitrolancea sp.]